VPEPETEVVIAADAEEGPGEAVAGIAAGATDVVEDGMAVAMADTVVRDDKDLLFEDLKLRCESRLFYCCKEMHHVRYAIVNKVAQKFLLQGVLRD